MEPSVLVAGETLVDFLPETAGPLAETERFERHAGGAPANVAVRLAQLGRPPWFWTRVGADPFGEFLAATLSDHGISGRFVERDPDAATTLAFVGDTDDPDFSFYRDGTADTRLEPGHVPDDALAAVEWVAVGGVCLSSEPSRTAVHDLVERAADHDCTVCFDPNARPELWPDADFAAEVRELLGAVDVLTATPGDLRRAGFDADDPEALAAAVAAAGPDTVFLTLGADGALGHASEGSPWGPVTARHAGYEVDTVDTTGAGDAFTAGVLDAFAAGETDARAVLARANAVAAAATTRAGGTAPLPDIDTVTNRD